MTVPNGRGDNATFGLTQQTQLSLTSSVEVAAIDFVSPASGYSIDVFPSATLIVSGNGVANSSSRMQNFAELVDVDGYAGQIIFRNAAGAGASTN